MKFYAIKLYENQTQVTVTPNSRPTRLVEFQYWEDILTALCLLRSAPALEKLEISKLDNVGTVSSCLDDNRSCSFTQLRHVIIEISGLEAELDFIRSPELETMTVSVEPGQLDMDVDECCFV